MVFPAGRGEVPVFPMRRGFPQTVEMKRAAAFLIPVVLIAAAWAAVGKFLLREEFHGDEFRRPAPDFSLTDHGGREFRLSDHRGEVVLLNFGFTNCPDVCPSTLGALGSMLDLLGERSGRARVVFITVDPRRDTVERLGGFMPFFHGEMVGLTGPEERIRETAGAYGVFYSREAEKSETDYLMRHSSSVFLIDRRGKMILKYPREKLDPAKMADDVRRLL